jgi:predicted CoA-substrate-specific enzyme activase
MHGDRLTNAIQTIKRSEIMTDPKDEDYPGRYYVGIDAGSVSLNCAVINELKQVVYEAPYVRHFGRIEEAFISCMKAVYSKLGEKNIISVSFTGNHGKNLSQRLKAFYEFETISQVTGALLVRPDAKTIISMGGQDTSVAQIKSHDGKWELEYFNTNGPCASGTGSFIDQQAERLATALYEGRKDASQDHIDKILYDFISLGLKSSTPSNVACRCTVFTKSDMIHLQNKGERLEDIIFGLHMGNARNYISSIVSNRTLNEPILFIGGLSMNALQVRALKTYFPAMTVPPCNTSIGALGVALQSLEAKKENRINLSLLESADHDQAASIQSGDRLVIKKTTFPETNSIKLRDINRKTKAYLGIDIGSTTTKYALINEDREIIHKCYVPTQGKPIETTQRLLKSLSDHIGSETRIAGVSTTGSGRNVVGDFLNADLIIDEITAHARGAVEIDTEVDTIFEIGGQDSKYIFISNSHPLDFDMNKVCAAGTGSFLHELANKYGINIVGEFQDIALSSENPVNLAERCTVFMESDLVAYHQKGVQKKDLIAGLCYAIAHNYLNRVVGKRKIGERVMFLGGPSLNKGVVAAFENVIGRALIVPCHREVLGAFGAAVSVQEKMEARDTGMESRFRGIENAVKDRMDNVEKICRADAGCHNQCKLKIYDFDGRKSIWGGECGRYDVREDNVTKKEDLFSRREKIWQAHMEGIYKEIQDAPMMEADGRPTVGMQRALYGLQTSLFWAHFFDQLGYRLVLSPPTNHRISESGIEKILVEACYPVKVSHGHTRMLMDKTRYLFLPTMIDMQTIEPERGYYCPMVQSNSYMLRSALGIKGESVLTPVIHMRHDPDTLALEIFEQVRERLDADRRGVRKAVHHALNMQQRFVEELLAAGRESIEALSCDEPFILVTGRPYNLYDERMNLRLGRSLSRMGVSAIPMDFIDLPSEDLSDFPSMFWGLGARILRAAKFVRRMPNCFGLHLTNFGCGADSFIEHFYRHIMGDKAYLILELDEHSAAAGVMTRLEAFKNVIENSIHPVMTRKEALKNAIR